MTRIAVIGLAAAAALTLAAPTASAKVIVNLGIGGFSIADPDPYGHPVYEERYIDPDCHYVTRWRWVETPSGKLKKKYYKKLICY